jgi:hypothetical protein
MDLQMIRHTISPSQDNNNYKHGRRIQTIQQNRLNYPVKIVLKPPKTAQNIESVVINNSGE